MFSVFVVLFNIVYHLLMSSHNFSLFIRVFYGDLLTLKTHDYKPNSMNSLNSMKELWKNSVGLQQLSERFTLDLNLHCSEKILDNAMFTVADFGSAPAVSPLRTKISLIS